MSEALSADWVAELNRRLAASPVGEAGGPRLHLGLRVRADDGSDRRFTAEIGGGAPGSFREGAGAPDVVLVETAATARRLADGGAIGEELAQGNIKLEGDVNKLLGAEVELRALAMAFAAS